MPEFGRWLVFIFSAISKTWFALKTNWFDSYITAIAPLMLAMIFEGTPCSIIYCVGRLMKRRTDD